MAKALFYLFLFLIAIALTLGGMFVSGYIMLYEIAIEYVFIMWSVSTITQRVIDRKSTRKKESKIRTYWKWFSNFKSNKIKEIFEGKIFIPIVQIVVLGSCIGWLIALVSIFFKDWTYVVSREVKETVFDIIVSFSLMIIVNVILDEQYSSSQEGDTNEGRYHPLDSEGYDVMEAYGEAQRSIYHSFFGGFKYALTSHLILIIGLLLFAFGWYLADKVEIDFLNLLKTWRIESK